MFGLSPLGSVPVGSLVPDDLHAESWAWNEAQSSLMTATDNHADSWAWTEEFSARLIVKDNREDSWTWAESPSVSTAISSSTTDAWTWTENLAVGFGDAGHADAWTWAEAGWSGRNDSSDDVWTWAEAQTLSGLSVSASSAERWAWIESPDASRAASSDEVWTWAEASSANAGFRSSATDAWTWAEVATSKLAMLAESADAWTWAEAPASALGIALIDESTDDWTWIELYPTHNVVYSFRVEAMAATRYEAFPYQSAAQFGDRVLLAGRDGLFVLSGDTDSSAEVAATVSTGMDDFGTRLLKRASTLTLDLDYADDMALTVEGRDPTTTTVELPVVTERRGKVKLARGQVWRRRQLVLSGPAPWVLRGIDEYPDLLSKRSGGA